MSERHDAQPVADGPDDDVSSGPEGTADDDELDVADAELVDDSATVPGASDDGAAAEPSGADDVARERDEYLDALRRLQADFENYKKRVARQFEDLSSRGVIELVSRLLPVIDALDLAEAHLLVDEAADGSLAIEAKALVQARALLVDTLSKEGLERVGASGESFDPTVHDAVAHTEGEDGPIVDEVLRSGYRWRGQVLRPAMVKVRG